MITPVSTEIMPITRRGASMIGYEFSRGRVAATGTTDPDAVGPELFFKVVDADERSLQLAEVNLSKIHFEPACPKQHPKRSPWPTGEEVLKKLKAADAIRLDAEVSFALFRKWQLLDQEEKEFPLFRNLWDYEDDYGLVCLSFDGTIYESSLQKGRLFTRMMHLQVGCWYEGFEPLDHGRHHITFSVLYRP